MKATRTAAWVLSVAALAAFGCASQKAETRSDETQAQAQAKTQPGQQEHMAMCPMAIPGTQVAATDTPEGVAVSFTTTQPDRVEQLRQAVAHIAQMHQRADGMGGAGHEGHGQCPGCEEGKCQCPQGHHGMHGQKPPGMGHVAADFRVENIENGAQVVLTPRNQADVEELRTEVHQHAEQMNAGQCPMMKHGGSEEQPG